MENLQQKVFRATVSSVEMVAPGVKKITFKLNEPFSFSPGQYVWVEIPEMKISDKRGERRAFSICGVPNTENTISVAARNTGSGYKQSLFELGNGDNVTIHGPFGSTFVLDEKEKSSKNIVMIAGGLGVSTFLPVLEYIKERSLPVKCFLVFLNKSKESSPFLDELETLKRDNPHFDYVLQYDLFSWDDVQAAYADSKEHREWWVSGSQAMVNHVYKELETGGLSRKDVRFENHYPSYEEVLLPEEIKEQLQHESLLVPAIQNSITHTIITDANGVILFANDAVLKNTGYSREEIVGNTPRLWGGVMEATFYKDFWSRMLKGETFVGEIVNRRKNGEFYYVKAHITPIFNNKRDVIGFIGTEDDVTDMEKLSKAKSDFVSIASHQLRAPLTAINWYVEMMQSEDSGKLSEDQKKYLSEIYTGSRRMVKLVNNLLSISRIETGRLKIDPERVDLAAIVLDIINEMKPWSSRLNRKVVFEQPATPLSAVSVDRTLIREVIQNMIVNAVQYSPQSPEVRVTLEEKEGECIVTVADQGIGISKGDQEKMYGKFFRAENARLVESEGSGIGMYISKSIMDASGGRMWFDSPTLFKKVDDKEVGYGTNFHISIPIGVDENKVAA